MYGPNVPAEVAKIIADAVIKVSESLGIDAYVTYEQRDDNCIFIRIKSGSSYRIPVLFGNYAKDSEENLQAGPKFISGSYSEASTKNFNTTGLDFHYVYIQMKRGKEAFCIDLQVGVKNGYYNENLLPKLKDYLNATKNHKAEIAEFLLKNYEGCTIYRRLRINKRQNTKCAAIKNYDSLKDYINDIDVYDVYKTKLTKADCIAKLQSLRNAYNRGDVDEVMYKLNRWADDSYNYLEQCSIAPPAVLTLDGLIARDPDTIAELERQIEIQLLGMVTLDYIYQH